MGRRRETVPTSLPVIDAGAVAPAPAAHTDAASATTGASVLKGGLWSGLTTVLPQLYVVVQSAVAARFLGVDGMGQQSFVSFVQVSAISLFTLGLNGALVRYVGETLGQGRPAATRSLVRWVVRIQFVAALLGGALLVLISLFSPELRSIWLLAAAGCVLGTLSSIPYSVLSGLQRWRGLSIASLVTNTAGTLATIAVLVAGGGIAGMFAVNVVIAALSLAWTGTLALRALPHSGRHEDAAIDNLKKPLLRFAGVVWLSFILSLIVWRRSEFFFLRRYSSDAQIALYSIAFAAVTALVSAFEAISLVLAPAVATLSGAGAEDRIRGGYSRALRTLLLAAMPVTAGAVALGPATVRLIYGADYVGTADPLLILLLACPLLPLMSLSSALLWGLGRARVWLTVCLVAAVANVTLDVLFIPGHGAVGAAIANTGAQVVATLGIVGYACRQMAPVEWHVAALARTALASTACGLVASMVHHSVGGAPGIGLAVIAGLLTFVVGGAKLRILPSIDALWLEETVGGHLGGVVGAASRFLSTGSVGQRAS